MQNKRLAVVVILGAIGFFVLTPVIWWLASPLFIQTQAEDSLGDNLVLVTATPNMQATMENAAANPTEVAEPMPTEIQAMATEQITALILAQGQFRDADAVHRGSGDAFILQLPTGELVLRFAENFRVTNGPDLHVYLVPRTNRETVDISGYVDLGSLSGSVGSQNYALPADFDPNGEWSIVIWCEPFAVLFSVASLTMP